MRKILVVCSSGLGTSLMIRLNLESILREMGMQVNVEHADASSISYHQADLVIGARQIVESLAERIGAEALGLASITDREHLRERLLASSFYQRWAARE
jgi:PTS system ascorbate-specific IIB component